jgi:hypothetical protein
LISFASRKILIQNKQILIQHKNILAENMKSLHSMSETCREAVVNMLRDITITSDSRCKLELTPK